MIYNLHINQPKAVEWGLSMNEAFVFTFVYELPSWADSIPTGNGVWYYGSRWKCVKELPILQLEPDTVYRIYRKFAKKGLIEYNPSAGRDMIKLTEKGKSWNWTRDKTDDNPKNNTDTNPTTEKEENLPENNSDGHPTNYIYQGQPTNLRSNSNELLPEEPATENGAGKSLVLFEDETGAAKFTEEDIAEFEEMIKKSRVSPGMIIPEKIKLAIGRGEIEFDKEAGRILKPSNGRGLKTAQTPVAGKKAKKPPKSRSRAPKKPQKVQTRRKIPSKEIYDAFNEKYQTLFKSQFNWGGTANAKRINFNHLKNLCDLIRVEIGQRDDVKPAEVDNKELILAVPALMDAFWNTENQFYRDQITPVGLYKNFNGVKNSELSKRKEKSISFDYAKSKYQ